MAVRFILGRAGTGKTHRCLGRIVESLRAEPLIGPPVFWIVPKQATFAHERLLATHPELPGAFSRARVLSFDLLGRQILADCQAPNIPEITPHGRQMILGLLLRRHQPELKFFSAVARQAGLAAKLDATFAELERSGKTPGDLAGIADDIALAAPTEADHGALSAKLQDLQLIYSAYTNYMGQERLDPHRRLEQVLGSIDRCSLLRNAEVYVDGFLDFSEYDRKVLAGIAKVCSTLEVTLAVDPESPTVRNPHTLPDELSLFYKTEEAYRRLYFSLAGENVVVDPPELLREVRRFASPTLRHIERNFLGAGAQAAPTAEGAVELVEAPDQRAEVDAAASRVRDLMSAGFRLREIAVLVRDPDPYMELLAAALTEHDIPHFLDRRRPATHHPVLQFMRAALQVVTHHYPHDAMMMLLKSGLAKVSEEQADALENYVLQHRVRGGVWALKEAWHARHTRNLGEDHDLPPQEMADLEEIDRLRRSVVDRLRPFVEALSKPTTVRHIVLAIFNLFEAFTIRTTMAEWMAKAEADGRLEQRAEHEQVWSELIDLFDQMAELLGDEPVALGDFMEILESGLETFDLGLPPTYLDQLLVGLVDRSRSNNPRAVILLGLNDGVFPRVAREDSVLSDAERRELRSRHVETEADSVRRQLDESLMGYIAMTRASERLILTRPTSDEDERPASASIFWRELRVLCRDVTVRTLPQSSHDDPSLISTPRHLVTSLMHWVRSGAGEGDGTLPALYQWLANYHTAGHDAIDTMRFRAWRALSYVNDATLSPEVRARLFPSPLTASASELECFAACPFKHFARYGLRLEPREEADPTAMDLGNVYHETLDRLVRSILQQKLDWPNLTEGQIREITNQCAAEVGQGLREELMLSNARNRYLLARIQRTIEKVAASQRALAMRGKFAPRFTELTFGFDEGLPPLLVETPHHRELRVRGKIDRVDLLREGAAFSIVDYKMADRRLNYDELRHGISLQLLTYLLVIETHGESLTGKPLTPAAAFYVKLLRSLDPIDHPDEAPDPADPAFPLKTKPRGIVDSAFATSFDAEFEPGTTSRVLAARINKDGSTGRGSDLATEQELAALLKFVRTKLGQLADQIIEGRIDILPYKLATTSACVSCDFRPLCRFHPRTNHYLPIQVMGRDGTIAQIMGGGADATT